MRTGRSAVIVGMTCCWAGVVQSQEDVTVVAQGIADYQRKILEIPHGMEMRFHVGVRQDAKEPTFVYVNGCEGIFRTLWPTIYVRIAGDMQAGNSRGEVTILKNHVRQATHDFSQGVGIAHDGKFLAQVSNFRHNFSSKSAFPIVFQGFAKADQFYEPNPGKPTDYWLPDALTNFEYHFVRKEHVSGIPCILIERPDRDRIWVAPEFGYVLVRREVLVETPQMRETLHASDIRQIAEDVWFPFQQVFDRTNIENGRTYELTLNISAIRVGGLKPEDLSFPIPEEVQEVEDHVARFTARRGDLKAALLAVEKELRTNRTHMLARSRMTRWALGGAAILLLFGNLALVTAVRAKR